MPCKGNENCIIILENNVEVFKKVKCISTYDPVITTLYIYPEEINPCVQRHTQMFIEFLFIAVKIQEPSMCLSGAQ
jgi:hypothetical protein